MTILLVHGAGSSADAARALLGPLLGGLACVALEDRTGDLEAVADGLDRLARRSEDVTHIVGVSLGAHAVAHWASRSPTDGVRLVMMLPAWTGAPDAAAGLTRLAAADVRARGIVGSLTRIREASDAVDVTALLEIAWSEYADAELVAALETAAVTSAPDADALVRLAAGSIVIGWEGDPLHPAGTARHWGRLIPRARVAVAARPSVGLLRAAIGATTGWGSGRARPRAAGP